MGAPDLAGLPRDEAGAPVFAEVWQARAFALAVHLNARGLFTWPEFSAALGAAIAAEPDEDYWHAWQHALEAVLALRGVPPEAITATAAAWQRAARATPHGTPIRLENAQGRPPDA